jgi:hypothetical protein
MLSPAGLMKSRSTGFATRGVRLSTTSAGIEAATGQAAQARARLIFAACKKFA